MSCYQAVESNEKMFALNVREESSGVGDKKMLVCSVCSKSFGKRFNLRRHMLVHNSDVHSSLSCSICEKTFLRKDMLKRHILSHRNASGSSNMLTKSEPLNVVENKDNHNCATCGKTFDRQCNLGQHMLTQHVNTSFVSAKRKMPLPDVTCKRARKQSEASSVFKTLMFYPDEGEENDLEVFQTRLHSELQETLQNEIRAKSAIKWYIVMNITLERETSNEDIQTVEPHFRSQCFTELVENTISDHISLGYCKIIKSFEEFIQRGSGWILKNINYLELKTAKYHPLAASSYIPLPSKLGLKKAILNIQNEDNKCLVWCLLAHRMKIGRKDHPERVLNYIQYENSIKLENIECPVPLQKIPIIEKLNNMRINVFGFEEDEVYPLYISPKENNECINLLLISSEEKQHYCLIRNFSRLLGGLTKHDGEAHYCYRCLHRFTRRDLLGNHMHYCHEHAIQAIKMPKQEDSILKFTGIHLQHPVAYAIYADFESLLVPIASATPSSKISYTEKMAYHLPCGYAYVIVGPDGRSVKPIQVYRGEDAVTHFLDEMMREKEILGQKLSSIKPMRLTVEEEISFREAVTCSICKKPLYQNRVKDHDHLTGAYREALHSECNINYRQSKCIPVIFHNLKNYDGHHLMTKLGRYKDHLIEVIASTLEKYIAFKVKKPECRIQMLFLDSFQFLPASLEKLVNNLEPSQFNILKENFPPDTPLSMLTRKGVYPYEYLTSFDKFMEPELPPSSAFYNTLTDEPIQDSDYQHAQNIWKLFKMENLGDYHDLYVKTDVLLLADVFQNFRSLCKQYYEIDCAHLFTTPGLAWQASLKMSETPLELLTDINMLLFIEKGIRGGISMISRRFAKANNHYMRDYNPQLPSSYIMYLDANNLYGWAMSQPLPYGEFKWCATDVMSEEWILSLSDETDVGYIFEVDLEYPACIHEMHNDYPLAPERMTVTEEMLSPYAKSVISNRKYVGTPKLIPNLKEKKKYVLHYRNLKLYLQLGLKLSTVHKALEFRQSPWLQKYIQFNTEKRKQATTTFEKDFFKLMNNSVFGKTMENLRNRRNIVLSHSERRSEKLVASPAFKAYKEFSDDLVAIERIKTSILMNRPIYVGFAILELSKLLMYNFHYKYIKKIYNEQANLLFTDTDSLTYLIKTEDIYEDMQDHASLFDFSDYSKSHPLFSNENKKVIGKFKDELNGDIALEFVGLKAKMYSIKTGKNEKKRAKGVSTHIVRSKLRHMDYVECLQQLKTTTEKQTRIAQDAHNLYTVTQNKITLSPFDDKRYLLEDGIRSLAYGHYKIKPLDEDEDSDS